MVEENINNIPELHQTSKNNLIRKASSTFSSHIPRSLLRLRRIRCCRQDSIGAKQWLFRSAFLPNSSNTLNTDHPFLAWSSDRWGRRWCSFAKFALPSSNISKEVTLSGVDSWPSYSDTDLSTLPDEWTTQNKQKMHETSFLTEPFQESRRSSSYDLWSGSSLRTDTFTRKRRIVTPHHSSQLPSYQVAKPCHKPRSVKSIKKLGFFYRNPGRTNSADSSTYNLSTRSSIKSLKSLSESFLQTDKMSAEFGKTAPTPIITPKSKTTDDVAPPTIKKKKSSRFLSNLFSKKFSSTKNVNNINNVSSNSDNFKEESQNSSTDSENDKKSFSYQKEFTNLRNTVRGFTSGFSSKKKYRAPNPPIQTIHTSGSVENLSTSMPDVNAFTPKLTKSELLTPPTLLPKPDISVFTSTPNLYQTSYVNCDFSDEEEDMVEEQNLDYIVLNKFNSSYNANIQANCQFNSPSNQRTLPNKSKGFIQNCSPNLSSEGMRSGLMMVRENNHAYMADNESSNFASTPSSLSPGSDVCVMKTDSTSKLESEYKKLDSLYKKFQSLGKNPAALTSYRGIQLQVALNDQQIIVKKLCDKVNKEKEQLYQTNKSEEPKIERVNHNNSGYIYTPPLSNTSTLSESKKHIMPILNYSQNSPAISINGRGSTSIRIDSIHVDTYTSSTNIDTYSSTNSASRNISNSSTSDSMDTYQEYSESSAATYNVKNSTKPRMIKDKKTFIHKEDSYDEDLNKKTLTNQTALKKEGQKIAQLWLGEKSEPMMPTKTTANKINKPIVANKSNITNGTVTPHRGDILLKMHVPSKEDNHNFNNKIQAEINAQKEREKQHLLERNAAQAESQVNSNGSTNIIINSSSNKINSNCFASGMNGDKIILVNKNNIGSPVAQRKMNFEKVNAAPTHISNISVTNDNKERTHVIAVNQASNKMSHSPPLNISAPPPPKVIQTKFASPKTEERYQFKIPEPMPHRMLETIKHTLPEPNPVKKTFKTSPKPEQKQKSFFELDDKESAIQNVRSTLRKISPPVEKIGMNVGRVVEGKGSSSSKHSESGISSDSSQPTSPIPPPPFLANNNISRTFKVDNNNVTSFNTIPKSFNLPPPLPPTMNEANKRVPLKQFKPPQKNASSEDNRNDLLSEIRKFGGAATLKKNAVSN